MRKIPNCHIILTTWYFDVVLIFVVCLFAGTTERKIIMELTRSKKYDKTFLKENMMGPNCIKLLEETLDRVEMSPGLKVLDLGCGTGLTSLFLAKEYDSRVFATDLWISATDNFERFRSLGVQDKIVPIHADALALPYAHQFFDMAVSVDAYQFFGTNPQYMDEHLAPLVKKGGTIAIVVAGIRQETDGVPDEIAPYINAEGYETLRTSEWWESLLSKSKLFELSSIWEMECSDEAWEDWLASDNPYAVRDRDMMKDAGHLLNLTGMIGKRI